MKEKGLQDIPHLYRVVVQKVKDESLNGAISYREFNRLLSFTIHLRKTDAKIVQRELADMGVFKLGNRGLKIIIEETGGCSPFATKNGDKHD